MTAATTSGDIYSRDIDLNDLLDGIEAGRVLLPNFQRDFDWYENDVVSLVATVLSGWPAGSLLLMTGRPTFFDLRSFEGAPEPRIPSHVVLDGQQRLTSLYHAFRGAGTKIYALRIDLVLEAKELTAETIEDAIVVVPREEWNASEEFQAAIGRSLVPLEVLGSAADYYEWRDDVVLSLIEEERAPASVRLGRIYRLVLAKGNHYKFPCVLLDNELEPAAIARIFERINKTGMRLSTFDLLVARSYSKSWNLRQEWLRARDEQIDLLKFLGQDGLAVAQVMSLRKARDVRQPALMRLTPAEIQAEWDDCMEAVVRACAFLVATGCPSGDWLPYRAQLLPLAALALEYDLEEHRDLLEAWFWGSSFAMTYEVASSTVASNDYTRLRNLLRSGELPKSKYRISRQLLQGASRKQQAALWRAFMCLLIRHGARDFVSQQLVAEVSGSDLASAAAVPPQPSGVDGGTAGHLLVMCQVLAQRTSLRRLRQEPVATRATVWPEVAQSQFLPTSELDGYSSDPEGLAARRVHAVEKYLVEAHGHSLSFVREVDSV